MKDIMMGVWFFRFALEEVILEYGNRPFYILKREQEELRCFLDDPGMARKFYRMSKKSRNLPHGTFVKKLSS